MVSCYPLKLAHGVSHSSGAVVSRAYALINLGDVARSLGEEGRAVSLYEEALALHRELGNDRGISRARERLGGLY